MRTSSCRSVGSKRPPVARAASSDASTAASRIGPTANRSAGPRVEPGELALRPEAAEHVLPLLEQPLDGLRGVRRMRAGGRARGPPTPSPGSGATTARAGRRAQETFVWATGGGRRRRRAVVEREAVGSLVEVRGRDGRRRRRRRDRRTRASTSRPRAAPRGRGTRRSRARTRSRRAAAAARAAAPAGASGVVAPVGDSTGADGRQHEMRRAMRARQAAPGARGSEIQTSAPLPFAAMPAVPPCACAIASTIARPSPLPPRARASSPLENRSKARAGEPPAGTPWPSSRTWISIASPTVRARDRDRALAVPERVVDEVAERLLEAEPSASHLASAVGSRPSSRRPRLDARSAKRSAVEWASSPRSSGSTRSAERRLVRAGDQQQVLGEQHEPVGLLGRRADRCAQLRPRVRGRRSASSSSAFRSASGVRSSWLASATKRRSCSSAASSRASMSFSVSARSRISSRLRGTGSRAPVVVAEIALARRRIDSTGRSARGREQVAAEGREEQPDRRPRRAARETGGGASPRVCRERPGDDQHPPSVRDGERAPAVPLAGAEGDRRAGPSPCRAAVRRLRVEDRRQRRRIGPDDPPVRGRRAATTVPDSRASSSSSEPSVGTARRTPPPARAAPGRPSFGARPRRGGRRRRRARRAAPPSRRRRRRRAASGSGSRLSTRPGSRSR